MSGALGERTREVSEGCTECGLCVKECLFLRHYGTPKKIADLFDPENANSLAIPYECSLCGLCSAVCPFSVRPETFFLEARREAVRRGAGPMAEHKRLLGYERAGLSGLLNMRALPEGCSTVFFPGCALSGTRPRVVEWTLAKLRETDPSVGVVLDCCTKPSHDLGREEFFAGKFGELKAFLLARKVERVLVACPNCLRIFRDYAPELASSTVYEELVEKGGDPVETLSEATVHDPCVLRDFTEVQDAVRKLTTRAGVEIVEREESRGKTVCCGEGGCVAALASDFSGAWTERAASGAEGRRIVTYCAGCANFLSTRAEVAHVLDLCADPSVAAGGKPKASRGFVTYLNRYRLKKRLAAASGLKETGGRSSDPLRALAGFAKALLPLLLLAAALAGVRAAGVGEYLEEEKLRGLIAGYGALAPLVYMAVYTVAPALFLPALPLTIVGGVLFGPFWGVVYTITSATAGACVAFLVSRHAARGFLEKRLTGSRWRKLDEEVAKNGWKVVAFTRLVPLFPFNLLNYALGLTKIGFVPYAVTTFLCMLPACVAFIVFSSSLLDLVNGRVSPALLVGIALIAVVSAIPVWLKKRKDANASGAVTARARAWSLSASLKAKAKLAALLGVAWFGAKWALVRFEAALSGYANVWEFTVNFVRNRLSDGDWALFADFARTAAPAKAVFALGVAAFLHAVRTPFAVPAFVTAAVAGRGALAGTALAGAGLALAALAFHLAGRFLLSDLAPLYRAKRGLPSDWALPRGWQLGAVAALAVPQVPLALPAALLGASRLTARRAVLLIITGCLARAVASLLSR